MRRALSLSLLLLSRCATARPSELVLPDRGAHTNSSHAGPLPDERVLGAMVRALSTEVEAIRGLRFVRPVAHRVLSVEAIAAHFREEGEDSDAQRGDELLCVALGHLRDESALERDAFARMMGAEAQGFYDPRDAILTLSEVEARSLARSGPAGIEARATVVHELVHALQHQRFAARVAVDDREAVMEDRAGVRVALLEGDATLVTLEWQARQRGSRMLGASDQHARVLRWTERAQMLTEANVPRYFLDAIELPYEAGAIAVSSLYLQGGWRAIDAALADESLRTGALLHPARAGSLRVVPEPALGEGLSRVLTRELGELELRLLFTAVLRKERAAELASHWRGDRVALDRDARGALVVQWSIATESNEAASAMAAALVPLLERWRREGCPRMRGSSDRSCEASVRAEGDALWVRRG